MELVLEMAGLTLLTKLITMTPIFGQLELFKENSEMCALGSKHMQSLISMKADTKMLLTTSTSSPTMTQPPKFIWATSVFSISETTTDLMNPSLLSSMLIETNSEPPTSTYLEMKPSTLHLVAIFQEATL